MEIVKNYRNVLTVKFKVKAGWEQKFLLTSDRHHDAKSCDRKLEKEHLDKALKENALIIDAGDLFDAMQGKFDPRRSYTDLRPEYLGTNYYDRIVGDAAEFYKPYAKNWLLMGRGNHDNSTLNNSHHDLLSALAYKLNTESGGIVNVGGYGGWIRFLFMISTQRTSFNLKYYHGSGGSSAPVTRGVIQTNRQAVYEPDANLVLNGHNHEGYYVAVPRERLSDSGVIGQDIQHHVRTPGYHIDFGDGYEGWFAEKIGTPKARGCAWLTLYCESEQIKVKISHDLV